MLSGPLSDFKSEHSNVEIRVLPPPNALHDRYIITSDKLLLMGHGLKDIGTKDSFMVEISVSYAPDLVAGITARFDSLWTSASSL